MHRGKVVIIGAGMVGATCAYTLIHSGIFSELAIIDVNKDKAEGDALDMSHGAAFVKPVKVTAGDYSQCKDADLIIIAEVQIRKREKPELTCSREMQPF